MPTIKELKEDLLFTAGLIDLLDTMKNSAVFQFRALNSKKERFDGFFRAIEDFFSLIGERGRGHVLINPSSVKDAAVIITSDEGFMGDLNAQVVNLARTGERFDGAELFVVGERGGRYLKDMGRSFARFKNAADSGQRLALASLLASQIIKGVKDGRFGNVAVSYPRCVSFMHQKPQIVNLAPLPVESKKEDVPADARELIVESPLDGIIDYLAEKFIRQKLIGILEESKLSEFAARAIHLEESSQDLAETEKKIKSRYSKLHHELIDKGTRELFSAQVIIRRKG